MWVAGREEGEEGDYISFEFERNHAWASYGPNGRLHYLVEGYVQTKQQDARMATPNTGDTIRRSLAASARQGPTLSVLCHWRDYSMSRADKNSTPSIRQVDAFPAKVDTVEIVEPCVGRKHDFLLCVHANVNRWAGSRCPYGGVACSMPLVSRY